MITSRSLCAFPESIAAFSSPFVTIFRDLFTYCLFLNFFMEVYNVVFVSGVQQSYTRIPFQGLFQLS